MAALGARRSATNFAIDASWRLRIKVAGLASAKPWGYKEKTPAVGAAWARQEGDTQMGALDAVLKALLPVTRVIDAMTTWIGKRLAWLILAAVVVSALNATVRKIFDISSNSWLELQWVLFSIVFLLCSPWTLLDNEHIRIDIVNNMLPKRLRDSIDAVGHAFFLLPLAIIMVITGIPFFFRSIEINEQSGNTGGLPQWPAKSLVMIGFAMLLIQGVSELIKRIAVMRDLIPDPHAAQVHALEAEVEHIVEAIEKR
jgi:TRAP-type mannitol/chloroaromatic compound transport system permease small subunit